MRCKPGDLAIVVPPAVKNVGRIVEVIEPAGMMDGFPAWIVKAVGEPIIGVVRSTGEPGSRFRARCPDHALRPISGVPLDDETPAEEPIKTNMPEALKLALGIEARTWA